MGATGTSSTLSTANAEKAAGYVNPAATHVSTQQWADALLTLIGAPVNQSNEANIQTWLSHEQDASSWTSGALGETAQQIQSNPLGVGGAGNHPTSIFQGLTDTAETLLQGYPSIVGALKLNTQGGKDPSSGPTQAFAAAVVASPWENGYGKPSYGSVTNFLANSPLVAGTASAGAQTGTGFSVTKGADAVKTAVGDVVSPVTSVAGLIGDITNPTTLKNVGIFVAGFILAGVGLLIFFSTTKEGKLAEKIGATAAVA